MNKRAFRRKIKNQQVCIYRRVSTKGQEKGEYKDQLKAIKSVLPELRITDTDNVDYKEFISGFSPTGLRMSNGLGSSIRWLKRNPNGVMVVAFPDRLARIEDVFMKVMKQGLGERIFFAYPFQSLKEFVESGGPQKLEAESLKLRDACREGVDQPHLSGPV